MQLFSLIHRQSQDQSRPVTSLLTTSILTACLLSSPTLKAASEPAAEAHSQQERIDKAQQELKAALKLTDTQTVEVAAILKDQREAIRKVFESTDLPEDREKLSWREKRKLMKQLRPIRKQTEQALNGVLSPEQMAAYKDYRKAQRERLKAQRDNQGS